MEHPADESLEPLDPELLVRVAQEQAANKTILETVAARRARLARAGNISAAVLGVMIVGAQLAEASALHEDALTQFQVPSAFELVDPRKINKCFLRGVPYAVRTTGESLERSSQARYRQVSSAIAMLQQEVFRAVPFVPSPDDVPVVCVFDDDL